MGKAGWRVVHMGDPTDQPGYWLGIKLHQPAKNTIPELADRTITDPSSLLTRLLMAKGVPIEVVI